MAKRKGSPVSGPWTRSRAAKERREEKTSEGGVENECDQLRCEVRELEGERVKVSEKRHELEGQKRRLEEQQRDLEEQLRPLRLEEEQLQRDLLTKRKGIKEIENAQRLDTLPREVWEKITDHLDENDLFPLALSCRYFRQKQKELVARARQSGKPQLALKTNLNRKLGEGQRLSAEYLRFCRKEKGPKNAEKKRDTLIRRLAAFHGHLPLLQQLLRKPLKKLTKANFQKIACHAARGGQLETLKWLRTRKWFKLNAQVFSSACSSGNLEMLKWLRSEGCTWGASACSGAARGGHLEVLKWLRSEGCPWNYTTWASASSSLIREWLEENGCPKARPQAPPQAPLRVVVGYSDNWSDDDEHYWSDY